VYGRGRRPRGCRRDGGGQGSCLRRSGSDSAAGGPECWALCLHVRSIGRGGGKARRADLLGEGVEVGRRWVTHRRPTAGLRSVGAPRRGADPRAGRRGRE